MVRNVTEALKAHFDMGWNLLTQIVDVCPEAVWTKKGGGYVFWQQLYHCFSAVNYFLLPKDGTAEPGPWGADVSGFKAEPTVTPGKEDLKAYAAKMKAVVDTWVAALDDAALSQNHEGFSARRGAPMSNATTLAIMSGHSMYHVGSCDAILRDNGEKGVM
jgi:hypothetical protein